MTYSPARARVVRSWTRFLVRLTLARARVWIYGDRKSKPNNSVLVVPRACARMDMLCQISDEPPHLRYPSRVRAYGYLIFPHRGKNCFPSRMWNRFKVK